MSKMSIETMNEIRQIKHKGELDLAGFKLPCYVLEDGTRVLSGRQMAESLKMIEKGDKTASGKKLVRNLTQKSLKPFINKEKNVVHFSKPIICYDGKQKINGYEATVLADICSIYLEAERNKHLSPRQKIIADQCKLLITSFAKVGIVALIDEATGYQHHRQNNELLSKWKKELKKEIELALTNYLPNHSPNSPSPVVQTSNSVGSFSYDPFNNSLTYQEKPCEFWFESKKGLNWFKFSTKKIRISLGLIFRENKLVVYGQIWKDGINKSYGHHFPASLNSKITFTLTSEHEQ